MFGKPSGEGIVGKSASLTDVATNLGSGSKGSGGAGSLLSGDTSSSGSDLGALLPELQKLSGKISSEQEAPINQQPILFPIPQLSGQRTQQDPTLNTLLTLLASTRR